MHELNAGLNAEKFANFFMLPKVFYHSFVLQMTFIHSTYTAIVYIVYTAN